MNLGKNGGAPAEFIEDLFTRWLEAYPLKKTTTNDLFYQLEVHFFIRFGYPRIIHTDNSPQFRKAWDNYCHRRSIIPEKIVIHHPTANPVERQNQNVKTGLRLRLNNSRNHNTWDVHLDHILFTLRRRRNHASQTVSLLLLLAKIP